MRELLCDKETGKKEKVNERKKGRRKKTTSEIWL